MNIETLGDMKNYLNNLDPKFLSEPFHITTGDGDGDYTIVDSVDELEEDYYQTDEGYIPESEFSEEDLSDESLSERSKKEKGTPRFWSKF